MKGLVSQNCLIRSSRCVALFYSIFSSAVLDCAARCIVDTVYVVQAIIAQFNEDNNGGLNEQMKEHEEFSFQRDDEDAASQGERWHGDACLIMIKVLNTP